MLKTIGEFYWACGSVVFVCMLLSASLFSRKCVRGTMLQGVRACRRRPLGEMIVIVLCVVGSVHYAATKRQGVPRRLPPILQVPSGTVPAVDFPTPPDSVQELRATGIRPMADSVFLRAQWPQPPPSGASGVEIYAQPVFGSEGWAGVGSVPISYAGDGFVVELPHAALPGDWSRSMFFTLGFDIDTDRDGLSDAFERLVSGTLDGQWDSDGDELPDGWEYEHGLDPNVGEGEDGANGDPDGDGLVNGLEYANGTDPQLADSDGDGLDDRIETLIGTNPNLRDTDGDGFEDGVEVENGMSPRSAVGRDGFDGDVDGDGIPNGLEDAYGTSPFIADSDGDGLLDGDELLWETDPLDADTDGDGIPDGEEVALLTDPCGPDTDQDGMPDGWELDSGLDPTSGEGEDGPLGDPDRDRLPNGLGYLYGTRPAEPDSDGDGLADGCEVVCACPVRSAAWAELSSVTDLTPLLTSWTCADYVLPTPVRIQGVNVGSLTVDPFGLVYFNRVGHVPGEPRSATPGGSMQEEIDGACMLVAPYWSQLLSLDGEDVPSPRIRIGSAVVDGEPCIVVEFSNIGQASWWDVPGRISFQLQIPAGTAEWLRVCYGGCDGTEMDGRNAVIGLQTFGFREFVQYGYYDPGMVVDGGGVEFLVGSGTDPARSDSDGDGLADGAEVLEHGSDPRLRDTDGDGVEDPEEVRLGMSSANPDSDGDGLLDGWELRYGLCPTSNEGVHGSSGDDDHDGLTNLQEQAFGSNPRLGDADQDGLDDGQEFLLGTDPDNPDSDGDGLSDADESVRGTNPVLKDSDGDGLDDGWEVEYGFNPSTPEGMQGEDACDPDEDGLSNLTEFRIGSRPDVKDTDGDGLEDGVEVSLGTDPTKADTDGDGLLDGYEHGCGLDPFLPDTDRDGLPDGWEVEHGLSPCSGTGEDGASGDPDGDGLSNIDEYRNGSDPNLKDTDGDGVEDGTEVANGADPADATDGGRAPTEDMLKRVRVTLGGDFAAWELTITGLGPDDRRVRRLLMTEAGTDLEEEVPLRRNNSYRLALRWQNCDGFEDVPGAPWYCWKLQIDGRPSVWTFDSYGSLRREGAANVILGDGWIAENGGGLLTNHIHENAGSGGNVAGGLTADLHVFEVGHGLLWETGNKANQIRNDTPKDDSSANFEGDTVVLGGNKCTFAVPRNFLYVVADDSDNVYRVTEQVHVPDAFRPVFDGIRRYFKCAAFRGRVPVLGSQAQISAGTYAAELVVEGSPDPIAEELEIRCGIDENEDGVLAYDESFPLEVCKSKGRPAYATVKGITRSRYKMHDRVIDRKVNFYIDNPPQFIAPHARSFLKLFYEPGSAASLSDALRPTVEGTVLLDAFSREPSCFAEWLTHNCGAEFGEDGRATIQKYRWDESTEVSRFMSQRTPFALKKTIFDGSSSFEYPTDTGRRLKRFYKDVVRTEAERLLETASDGTETTLPLDDGWYGQEELQGAGVFVNLSPSWVPGLTLDIGSGSNYGGYDALAIQLVSRDPAFDDFDAFGTIGRGRVLNVGYRFRVRKVVPLFGPVRYEVVSVQFKCDIEDLYDFNYEDGELPSHAAALQIGFRRNGRNKGGIYAHAIKISTTYLWPFLLENSTVPLSGDERDEK